jgi:UDP-N-acetylmuramate dehydrogenase
MIEIQKNIKLADYSTFKIGGPAKEFVAVQSEEDLKEALEYGENNKLKIFILGGGSNILFSDSGFDGLVIKINNNSYLIQDNQIECGAGLPLSQLVNLAKDNNLSGLEWAVGIPGTVGGAVRGNAGAFGGSMGDIVEKVRVLDIKDKQLNIYDSGKCEFGYRNSVFKKNHSLIIVSTEIRLEKGDKEKIDEKMKEIITKRAEKQPKEWKGSAGSFFENPVVDNAELINRFSAQGGPAGGWEKEREGEVASKRIPAGWLIEEAGLKGKKVGNVAISETNANFIINTGGGTAEEIIMLASIIKQKVRDELGVQLKEEVNYVI